MGDAGAVTRTRILRRRVLFWVLLIAVVLVSGYRYAEKIGKPSRDGTQTKSAILRWRDQIEGLAKGEDIYAKYNYPNPPVQAIILSPLVELDRVPGALLWFALKVGMACLSIVWAFRLVRGDGPPLSDGAKLLTIVFAAHAILGDLSHGNVNIFIAFLVFAALELQRRARPVAGGLTLALAIACKVTPALFVPYFVWKRAWRMVLGCVVGCGLWLLVVPGIALGWQHNADLLASWFNTMVKPFVIDGRVTSEHANQSIPGLTFRLLTSEPSTIHYPEDDDGKPHADEFHNVADIGKTGAKWVVRGCQGLFVLGVVGLCRTRSRTGRVYAAECSYVMLGMLLFSERTWKHHGVVLILPFAVLASVAFDRAAKPWLRKSAGGIFAAVLVLILGPSTVGGEGQDLALTYGSHTAVFLLLTAGVLLVLLPAARRVTPPGAGPSAGAAGTSTGPAASAAVG